MRAMIRATLACLVSATSIAMAQAPERAKGRPTADQIAPEVQKDAVDEFIEAEMERRGIPGLSLAIIKGGEIVKARGYGVTEKGGETPVTPSTLFQAGSISKPVSALGALRLVERGELDLDEDVNAKLATWKVPENKFTQEKKVTLRRLLSHTAGMTVHGFPGYAADGAVPTLVQVLDGEKPANTGPIRVDILPGSRWRYSGGGYTVMQQMVIDVTGEPFPRYMREAVLGPLGMEDSTFDQPLSPERASLTATGHGPQRDRKPVKGKWHVYPEMAAAGLWTTPSDLARFAVGVQEAATGKSEKVLSREMARRMLTVEKDGYGLGFGIQGSGATLRFGHGGRDEGFDALLAAYAEDGHGAVIMINANDNSQMVPRILDVIAREYGWPDRPPATSSKPPAARAELQVGAAKRVITPDPLLPVSGGMGAPKPAREKRGDLTARAVVFRKGDVSVAVVSLDLLGFPSVLGDRVRAKVTRIPPENILIGSTHTHSAPDCYAFPDGKGGHTGDLEYMDLVCDRAAEAINEAIDRLQPAAIKVATGEARGKIAYNYYAPDLYDRRMSVIQAVGPDGKAVATLVNYAIHPEVLGNDIGILSPDLIGPLCDDLESRAGGMALFMNGAQGGMITADNRDLDKPRDPLRGYWDDARTWEECLRIGRLMADEALRIVADAPEQKDPALTCDSARVRFPVESDAMWAVVTLSPLKYPHGDDRSVSARINLVNLGDAQILTVPGEALPNIGFYLKRKMKGKNNLLFGLTNDAFGYILTKVDFQSFPRYDYVSRTSLGEMTGEILIEESLKLIERSPAPAR